MAQIRNQTLIEKKLRENFNDLDFGDYALVYLKEPFNDDEEKQELVDLLKQVHDDASSLPTVGAELGYSKELDQKIIDHFNDASYVLDNAVPKNYSSKDLSEIRILPTNPYTFRWLLEEMKSNLPDNSCSVQVCIGDVFEERMPHIFLALYFLHPSCVFPPSNSYDPDWIGFPGAYVGQTVNKQGILEFRAQTNYAVFHSNSYEEISDSVLYAAKFHSLDDDKFKEFEEDLRKVLGFPKARITREGHVYVVEDDGINNYLTKKWPNLDVASNAAYQMPFFFSEGSVRKAKMNLGIKNLESNCFNLTEEDMIKIRKINNSVKSVIEKHINTSPLDIIYRTSLEEVLKNKNHA
ncbi:hypothetical protein HY837_03880 [archaeon]|nr:hypothetical protein [archaeon]